MIVSPKERGGGITFSFAGGEQSIGRREDYSSSPREGGGFSSFERERLCS